MAHWHDSTFLSSKSTVVFKALANQSVLERSGKLTTLQITTFPHLPSARPWQKMLPTAQHLLICLGQSTSNILCESPSGEAKHAQITNKKNKIKMDLQPHKMYKQTKPSPNSPGSARQFRHRNNDLPGRAFLLVFAAVDDRS